MKAFLLALQFFTIASLRPDLSAGPEDLRRSRAWYGPVGVLLGLSLAGVAWLLLGLLPPLALAGFITVLWGVFTRFLHLDGVADTADALIHIASRERALEIMKDSRVGSFGVCAVAAVLLVKFAALASLAGSGGSTSLEGGRLLAALALTPGLARALAGLMAALLPPARREGLGAAVTGAGGLGPELTSAALALMVAGLAAGRAGLMAALGVILVGVVQGWWCRRRLGGVTGDTLGASIESAEVAALLVLCAA
ncbi:MAG: adenosylcobinamide-GDP ribazoletransferase [Thermodesulfobacteriota bacterium]